MEEEQQKQEIHNQKLADITEQFVSLSENIDQLGDANETSANEATTLAQHIQEISNFCQELNSSLATMSDFINIYKASNEDISSIAGQTNLLSLNASIEAARAGEAVSYTHLDVYKRQGVSVITAYRSTCKSDSGERRQSIKGTENRRSGRFCIISNLCICFRYCKSY